LEGGHDVADPIIEQRYQMGMSYLKTKMLYFSEITLVDVSTHSPIVWPNFEMVELPLKILIVLHG